MFEILGYFGNRPVLAAILPFYSFSLSSLVLFFLFEFEKEKFSRLCILICQWRLLARFPG